MAKTTTKTTADPSTTGTDQTATSIEQATAGAEQVTTTGEGANGADATAQKPKKPSKKGQPVQLGNRRRLGLALRGLLAEIKEGTVNIDPAAMSPAMIEAEAALAANKYTDLKPQAALMEEVGRLLNEAIAKGDGKLIASYGKAINRIKAGQPVDLAAIGRQPAALAQANADSAAKALEGEAATV